MKQILQQHYEGHNDNQEELKRFYEKQQTEIGQAALKVQKEFADKLRSKGIHAPLQEMVCMVNAKTDEKHYYMKG